MDEQKVHIQHPFEFGVYFGMGLIVAPIVLAAIIGAVIIVMMMFGVAFSAMGEALNRPPVIETKTVVRPAELPEPEPEPVVEPVAVPAIEKPKKDIPWAGIIFGTLAVTVAVGGGSYVYYLMRHSEDE